MPVLAAVPPQYLLTIDGGSVTIERMTQAVVESRTPVVGGSPGDAVLQLIEIMVRP